MKTGKHFPHCVDCGKELSRYGYKRCISCWYKWNILENHSGWIDGRSFEPYDRNFNKALKEFIHKRDNNTCQICKNKQKKFCRKLDVHHIDYYKFNCKINNLITLCRSCNIKVNSNRDYWFAYFTYIMEEVK
jgi:hypothetical protein